MVVLGAIPPAPPAHTPLRSSQHPRSRRVPVQKPRYHFVSSAAPRTCVLVERTYYPYSETSVPTQVFGYSFACLLAPRICPACLTHPAAVHLPGSSYPSPALLICVAG